MEGGGWGVPACPPAWVGRVGGLSVPSMPSMVGCGMSESAVDTEKYRTS